MPNWVRHHGFVLALILAVVLGFLFPGPGSRGGVLHADLASNLGIALILFLQGLSLAWERIRSGVANWRLHLVIQTFTFGVFPVVGLLLHFLIPLIWVAEPKAIDDGFLYLCVLPSTISTSVVLTALARGNTAGALFNAAFSNILGVFLTPLLVHLLMTQTGQSAPFGPLLLKITLLTMVPFFAGMVLRTFVRSWLETWKAWIPRISNGVIVFIVYSAFCDSVQDQIWRRYGLAMTFSVFFWVILLFAGMSGLIYATCRMLRLDRENFIAAYFCAVKKTLAMGVPLAMLIFGKHSELPLILLPLMFYHPLQLFVNGLLANIWAKEANASPSEIRLGNPTPRAGSLSLE